MYSYMFYCLFNCLKKKADITKFARILNITTNMFIENILYSCIR